MLQNNTENALPKIICLLVCSLKKSVNRGMYDSLNNGRVRRRGESVMGKIASAIVAVTLLTSPLLLPVPASAENGQIAAGVVGGLIGGGVLGGAPAAPPPPPPPPPFFFP